MARVRVPAKGGYTVRSTKEKSKIEARKAAVELAMSILAKQPPTPKEFTFKTFVARFLAKARQMVTDGERNGNYVRTQAWLIENDGWGLMRTFGGMDVRSIKTHHYNEYIKQLGNRTPRLAPSSINSTSAAFRNVMKVARDEGVIEAIPATPRVKQKDNPRPYFRFHPMVEKERDEYALLKRTIRRMAMDRVEVRGTTVTEELYDLVLFAMQSFVRPMTTELFAIRFNDIAVADSPARLLVTIRNGKTGSRVANTMEGAVAVWKRIKDRYPSASGEDFIFLPQHPNRDTASRIIERQFNEALDRAGLKADPATGAKRTLYSLRHTALCMRLVNSDGQVNIYNLAKNAGTSVEQIERFYAKNLPLTAELARNLQIFDQSRRASQDVTERDTQAADAGTPNAA
jgi:hypothetical protein